MEIFDDASFGKVYTLRINPGEDFLRSIEEAILKKGLKFGVIVTAIATFKNCVLHMISTTSYPPVEHYERWEDKPLELAAISGVIADGVPHIHMVVSDKVSAYAGHCHHGCTILYICEVVIAEIIGLHLHRVKNEENILQLVKADSFPIH